MDHLLSDLGRSQPLFVIDTSPGNYFHWGQYPIAEFPRLQEVLDRAYALDLIITGTGGQVYFNVYKRRSETPVPQKNSERELPSWLSGNDPTAHRSDMNAGTNWTNSTVELF